VTHSHPRSVVNTLLLVSLDGLSLPVGMGYWRPVCSSDLVPYRAPSPYLPCVVSSRPVPGVHIRHSQNPSRSQQIESINTQNAFKESTNSTKKAVLRESIQRSCSQRIIAVH